MEPRELYGDRYSELYRELYIRHPQWRDKHELNLRITPVIVGDGLRLFPEHGQTHDLELVESRSLPSVVWAQIWMRCPASGAPSPARSTVPDIQNPPPPIPAE